MTKSIRRFILGAVAIGGITLLSFRISYAETNLFRLAIPAPALDLSDLDVRDAQNHKVTSPAAIKKLEKIFTDSLFQSVMHNLTPVKRAMVVALAVSWKASHAWLGKLISRVDRSLRLWFNAKKKKLISWAVSALPADQAVASWPTFNFVSPSINTLDIISSTQLRR